MFRAWYVPLYHFGIIHGDPHLGNYSVREDDSINLLDFGCIRVFPPSFVGGVIDLYNALMEENDDLAVHAYETWGFKNLTQEQIETLNIWARFLYAPVMEDKIRVIGETNNGVYGRETAQKVHRNPGYDGFWESGARSTKQLPTPLQAGRVVYNQPRGSGR